MKAYVQPETPSTKVRMLPTSWIGAQSMCSFSHCRAPGHVSNFASVRGQIRGGSLNEKVPVFLVECKV